MNRTVTSDPPATALERLGASNITSWSDIHDALDAVSRAGKPPLRSDLPQFTLRGLFAFSTAIIVCLSLGATAARVSQVIPSLGVPLYGLTAALTWVVLGVTYRSLRLRAALVVHLGVPACLFGFGLLVELHAMASDASTFGFHPAVSLLNLLVLSFGFCVVGSVLSVPVLLVTMIISLLRGALRRRRLRYCHTTS